ncbi:hypothetical protein NDU88_003490 [Pleurodeles waltl]|uniref:Uncharacterized protein n=1 Tax=Pleurodeles waltl TaxID=8319 RepID=A0AAV7SFL3_PLEWA|nr:hypothetical protein NDU88_003490 [Pleurodeles waltl]
MCCFCKGTNLRLEESQPAPPEGTPSRDMYVKHGLSSIMYSTLWNKYTRADPELRWPIHGSFDLRKIEYVEQCMCKRKSRQDMFDCVRMWEKEARGRVKREQALLEKEQRKNVYVKALEIRKKEINDLKELEEKERKLQVADAIRRLMKLRIVAVRLQEEKRAADAVARASQTEGAQASIFETDKTMIVHAKPMREATPLYVPPKGLGTNDDKTSVDAKGYFIYIWVYTPWNRADVMALKTALPDPRKNPAAFYEEVEGAISSCTMTLADIDLFFGLILPPDMWRTVRKIDDRTVFGASWKEIEQMDGDREPAKKPYQLILDLPAAILVKLKMIIPPR